MNFLEFRQSKERNELSVIDSFSFSYEVHWPLSLILNRKSIACYQMIFRHLFFCKYVERIICQVWRSNKVAKKFPLNAAVQYRTAFSLRQRMLHCVQNLEYHMMVEVVEPHWCTFVQKMAKVREFILDFSMFVEKLKFESNIGGGLYLSALLFTHYSKMYLILRKIFFI